jgi:hydroxyacylglutathione hydrolase
MPVLATRVGNAYDHVSYFVYCAETGEAAAIDPFHIDLTLETARSHGLNITGIVNTHEHWDHAGRNDRVRAETGARVFAPKAALGVIETVDTMLAEGDVVTIGTSCPLRVLATPGHTMTHISLLGEEDGAPFLLCGDTLFGAGVGNCAFGGHAPTLYETVERLRSSLDPRTILYPGHDYLARNLEFTLRYEPDNAVAAALLREVRESPRFTSIADEMRVNLFFRPESVTLRHRLSLSANPDDDVSLLDVFLALRAARDIW